MRGWASIGVDLGGTRWERVAPLCVNQVTGLEMITISDLNSLHSKMDAVFASDDQEAIETLAAQINGLYDRLDEADREKNRCSE